METKYSMTQDKYTKYRQWTDKEKVESKKGRARIYPTLRQALSHGDFGDIVTTPRSDDIYVITSGSWGRKSANKVVKSFSGDTPWSEIVAFSKRTKIKHGEGSEKDSKDYKKDKENA
jgi:hypothetical protein